MSTLREIKKQRGLTNADIGKALGYSAATAGMILQGRHIHVYHDEQIQQLADILGITFERCWMAMGESYNEFFNTPGMIHQRADVIRAMVQVEYQLPVDMPRDLAMIDGSLVVPQERWLEQG